MSRPESLGRSPVPQDPLPDRAPVMKIPAMPQDVNPSGDIFGGWLMSQVDMAGAILAIERSCGRVATRAVREFQFLKPVKVGDLVLCYAEVTRVGNTSITVDVHVYVERRQPPEYDAETHRVAEASLVYVALDAAGNARPVPPAQQRAAMRRERG
ncbi:MAG: acyl-CoA thioesterase [Chromatiales bacterium]